MSLSIPRNHLQAHHWTWSNIAHMSAWVEEGDDEVQQLGRQVQQWLLGHCQLTRLLGKPEILEEERRRGRIRVVFTDSCQQDFSVNEQCCYWLITKESLLLVQINVVLVIMIVSVKVWHKSVAFLFPYDLLGIIGYMYVMSSRHVLSATHSTESISIVYVAGCLSRD